MTDQKMPQLNARTVVILIIVGLAAGFLSGMFGVGGGIIIIPALITFAGFEPRLASGTSLTTIVPLALVGVVSYAIEGHVSWVAAGLLALGALGGSQVGTWLLSKVRQKWLQLGFAGFMLVSVVMLFVVIPSRDSHIEITWGTALALVVTGFLTGVLSGLLGVGGGIIVVPALMLGFGASDLVAKGTSLLMMIPTALSGTIPNMMRKNLHVPTAIIVGLSACCTTFLGSFVAHRVSPLVANICFAIFLVAVATNLVIRALRSK